MELPKIINVDEDILSGQPVFAGSRVPVESLFDHLKSGISISDFMEDFPTTSQEQIIAVLDIAFQLVTKQTVSNNLKEK